MYDNNITFYEVFIVFCYSAAAQKLACLALKRVFLRTDVRCCDVSGPQAWIIRDVSWSDNFDAESYAVIPVFQVYDHALVMVE